MPFIEHYSPKVPIIELVYGEIECQELVSVIVALLQNKDNVVVISSDLSHFYPLKEEISMTTHACLLCQLLT